MSTDQNRPTAALASGQILYLQNLQIRRFALFYAIAKAKSEYLDLLALTYFYGARYYDPRVSTWISTDKALDKFIPTGAQTGSIQRLFPFEPNHQAGDDHQEDRQQFEPFHDLLGHGGVYEPLNLAVYTYSGANPITHIDPDGNSWVRFVAPLAKPHFWRGVWEGTKALLTRGGGSAAAQTIQNVAARVPVITNQTVMTRSLMNEVRNPRLLRTVDKMFKAGDTISGGTAGAIRNELATGLPTKGKFHSQAGKEMINRLSNILKEEKLDGVDKRIANDLITDLKDALKIQ